MKNLLAIIISIIMIFSVGGQLTNSIYKNRGTESASKVRKSARINNIAISADGTATYNGTTYDSIEKALAVITAEAEKAVLAQKNQELINEANTDITEVYDLYVASKRYSENGIKALKAYADQAIVSLSMIDLTLSDIRGAIADVITDNLSNFMSVKTKSTNTPDGLVKPDTSISDYDSNYDPSENGYYGDVQSNDDVIDSNVLLIIVEQKGTYVEIAKETYESSIPTEEAKTEIKALFDIYLAENGRRISYTLENGIYTVRILIPEEYRSMRELEIVYIADNGQIEKFATERVGNFIIFKTNHFSDYALVGLTELEQTRIEQIEKAATFLDELDTSVYSHDQFQEIKVQYNEVITKLESKTVEAEEMVRIVLEFVEVVENSPTALDKASEDAIKGLKDELAAIDPSKYTKEDYEQIVATYEEAIGKISKTDNIEEIEQITIKANDFVSEQSTITNKSLKVITIVLLALAALILTLYLFYFKVNYIVVDGNSTSIVSQKRTFWLFKIKPDKCSIEISGKTLEGIYLNKDLTEKAIPFRMPFGRVNLYLSFNDLEEDEK